VLFDYFIGNTHSREVSLTQNCTGEFHVLMMMMTGTVPGPPKLAGGAEFRMSGNGAGVCPILDADVLRQERKSFV